MKEKKIVQVSRKDFLKGSGASLAGLVLLGGIGGLISGCAPSETATPASTEGTVTPPPWPYPYVKLDADKGRQRAYEAYAQGG